MAANNYDISRLNALNDIGTSTDDFDSSLTGAEKACGDFVQRVAKNINDKDLVDTGKILDITVQKVDNNTINIVGYNYVIYLDEGIQGAESNSKAPNSPFKMSKMPPPETFANWIKRKNIRVRDNTSYGGTSNTKINVEGSIDKAAYAMALTRYKEGYEPQDIFKKEIPQLADEAAEGVANTVVNQFLKTLDNI